MIVDRKRECGLLSKRTGLRILLASLFAKDFFVCVHCAVSCARKSYQQL